MDWTHNGCTYQIADRDGLAIFYLVAADHPTMRGETYDRTAQEVEETLRLGLFKLLDVLAVPSALSPYIGFFEAINGNRQVIGLKLSDPATGKPTGQKRHILGRAPTPPAPAPSAAATHPVASRLVERSVHDEDGSTTCPYLTTLVSIDAAPDPPRAPHDGDPNHVCQQSRALAMTATRLQRLCRSAAYRSCRHYRYAKDRQPDD